jgi:ribosomal-protein-alanine N-acetyltransferase
MEINTPRLKLIPLTMEQLTLLIEDIDRLEAELDLPIAREMLDDPVPRAVRIKLGKMSQTDPAEHHWLTYWLIVINEGSTGVGLAGYKSLPNKKGHVEIGYGIDPAFQNSGYMTEAVRALIDWAFEQPECQAVTATTVTNPASNRLLEKVGMRVVVDECGAVDWIIEREKS